VHDVVVPDDHTADFLANGPIPAAELLGPLLHGFS
jgi:hypothetical protein